MLIPVAMEVRANPFWPFEAMSSRNLVPFTLYIFTLGLVFFGINTDYQMNSGVTTFFLCKITSSVKLNLYEVINEKCIYCGLLSHFYTNCAS